MKNFERIIAYSDVFESKHDGVNELLKGIDRDQLINAAVFFLGFKSFDSKYHDNKSFLDMFFCTENQSFKNEVLFKITQLELNTSVKMVIPNHLTSLKFFEIAFNHQETKTFLSLAESEINLLKVYLSISEEVNLKQDTLFTDLNNLAEKDKLIAMTISISFPYFDFVHYSKQEILITQFIKSIKLFEFLEQNDNSKPLIESFNNYFEVANWKEYLLKLLPIVLNSYNALDEQYSNIVVETGVDFESSCKFIDKLSTKKIDKIEGLDHILIRSNPIHKVKEGFYYVIFDLFLIELLHTGLYFKLNELNSELSEEFKIKNFRTYYCDNFSEKKLLYEVLETIYNGRYIKFSGSTILNKYKIEAEPDFIIPPIFRTAS